MMMCMALAHPARCLQAVLDLAREVHAAISLSVISPKSSVTCRSTDMTPRRASRHSRDMEQRQLEEEMMMQLGVKVEVKEEEGEY